MTDVTDFQLDASFTAITTPLDELPLCAARLTTDARFPWIILIPRIEGVRELEELSEADLARLMKEVLAAGRAVRAIGEALGRPVEKLNIAAIGNVTPQLHVHVIGRRRDDAAWPGTVWGFGTATAYDESALAAGVAAARKAFRA